MPSEAITSAIRSVLGDYASPEKIAALDAVLRPIYGAEAAVLAFVSEAPKPEFCTDYEAWGQGHDDHAEAADARIRNAFGATNHDR